MAAKGGDILKAVNNSQGVPSEAAAHTVLIEFNEEAYLRAFDDVILALDTGDFTSPTEHFEMHGKREGRLLDEKYMRALGFSRAPAMHDASLQINMEALVGSRNGTILMVGWMDDRSSPLHSLLFSAGADKGCQTTAFGRIKRKDVDTALGVPPGYLFGFWAVVNLGFQINPALPLVIRFRQADGHFTQISHPVKISSDPDLRTTILGFFAGTEYTGSREIESLLSLDSGIGAGLVALNRRITSAIVAGVWVSYYGPVKPNYLGSIIVCLYGKPEFLFVQAALFSLGALSRDYEYIFVSNSPELSEILVKESRNCARIYGISIVLVCLPDNAGFGAANNIAARYARSNRIMITNPDVFPRDNNWGQRHADILAAAPKDQTLLFGAPLFYDDGSLMHHGMYFEVDAGISVRPDGINAQPMIRTEHYGKGAPPWTTAFACPRPVPAITGAFMSADRDWFERLGGFTEDFLFGHYEDADLSLKSLMEGKPVWMQDFPLWHMEGKGSTRRQAHEGGILINRWLFTRKWGPFIEAELKGPNPASAALRPEPAALKTKAPDLV